MYNPPWFLFNHHLETIWPSLFRKVTLPDYERKRISTPDHDFLDLDILRQGSSKAIVISHGLEGNTQRSYVKGMAKAFYNHGFDVIAWNYRSCSEEMNNTLRFYHSGSTDDLNVVINEVIQMGYNKIFLVGFSLGGNLSLKYAGETTLDKRISALVVFSVPLNLDTSCTQLSKSSNRVYANRFLRNLKRKVKAKSVMYPNLNVKGLDAIRNLRDFDNRYTAPLHGFKDAEDYYSQCSSINFLHTISIPTLIVNALNDPFLSHDCFPKEVNNKNINLEFPRRGGHVGFMSINRNGLYWSEQRALDFILPFAG
ncbi:MAG: alpha/beta fold hydrolase [Bacteroidetes bacterium]|nr:alpha/beta fold hydrolase [Bacteroidota bacterium]